MTLDKHQLRRRRDSSTSTSTHRTALVVPGRAQAAEKGIGSEAAALWAWHELPDWRRDNAFIATGYRPTSNSYRTSLGSVLALHNESVNIWTHLAGAGAVALAALGLVAHGFFSSSSSASSSSSSSSSSSFSSSWAATATPTDALVFASFLAGAGACLGMSAAYHALSNHSAAVARRANKLDYTGIVALIVGSYMPALYYGLYCQRALLRVYLSLIWTMGLGCVGFCWIERFRTPQWRPYRALLFVGLGASGLVPIFHGAAVIGYAELRQRIGLDWVLLQGFLYVLGATIYALRWPERRFPLTFDIWASSHQIFHVLVLGAAAAHWHAMVRAFEFHHGHLGAKC